MILLTSEPEPEIVSNRRVEYLRVAVLPRGVGIVPFNEGGTWGGDKQIRQDLPLPDGPREMASAAAKQI